MKITSLEANSRKRLFEVRTRNDDWTFPFTSADPPPSPADPVVQVFPDPELGHEGFTYVLQSGAEGTVHLDSVLEYNEAPGHMAELALYRLSTQARKRFKASPLSAREIARLLGTSPTQLYRLLDPTNYAKSAHQLLALLYVLKQEAVERQDWPDDNGLDLIDKLWSRNTGKRQQT